MEETTRKRKLSGSTKEASPIDFHGGDSLDEDALTEILLRLPEKSVVRFKSVCKSWLSLISSKDFHRLYTEPFKRRPIPLILTVFRPGPRFPKQIIKTTELFYDSNQMIIETRNEKQRRIPFDICCDNFVIVLSCCWNGLLLLMNMIGDFHVYNPITNQSQKIFLPDEFTNSAETLHLVFNPSKSLHYKIVYIQEDRIRAFDSESRTWSVCVEGFSTRGKTLFYLIHGDLLYCFNIVKDASQFTVCPLPKLPDQGIFNGKILHESANGCVYYCAFVKEHSFKSTTGAVLWELQVNGDGDGDGDDPKWLLKYHHRIPRLPDLFVQMLAFFTETSTVLFHVCDKIMAYNFLDKTYKQLPLDHLEPLKYFYVHVGQTLPSF